MYGYGQADVVFTSCHIYGNISQPDVYGGAFHLDGNATLRVLDCMVAGFHALQGGAFAVYGNSSVQAHNCTVESCIAVEEGGGIFATSASSLLWI